MKSREFLERSRFLETRSEVPSAMKWTRYCFSALTALTVVTLPLHANVLLPGGTVSPDIFPNPSSVSLLDQTGGTFSFGSGMGLNTGSYVEAVAIDPFGVTCSDCLDSAYQVSLDPFFSAGIFNVGLGRYFGYSTDVGYIDGSGDNPCCSGDGAPIAVSRGPFGGTLEFVFTPTAGEPIGAGGQSAILIVAPTPRPMTVGAFWVCQVAGPTARLQVRSRVSSSRHSKLRYRNRQRLSCWGLASLELYFPELGNDL